MKHYILKYILIFLSILLGVSNSYSQAIEKGTGMTYTKGIPTHIPRIKFDAEINMDINTGRLYQWSQPVNQWRLMARGVDVGNFNGAPSYVPGYGQSTFVINNQKQIYYYFGNVWSCLTCAVGAVGAYNGLSRFSDSIVLGGTLDRSTTIRGVSTFPLIFDSLSTFRVTTRATLGNSYNVISSIPFLNNGITLSAENVLDPNISTSLNVRAQNESQLASRNSTNQAYFRLTPTSAYLGSGLVADPSSNKQFRIENDSFLFINMEYAPTKSNDFLVIRPDGSVFKDSSSYLQSLSLSGDTLFISEANYVILSGLGGAGNGIYGGSGTTPTITTATVDSILLFQSNDSKSRIQVRTTNSLETYGSDFISTPDSVRLYYFDAGSDSRITLNQNGVLLRTTGGDRLTIQGADARYAADYRSTYSDRSLIDKKYGDDFYKQNLTIDSLVSGTNEIFRIAISGGDTVRFQVPQGGGGGVTTLSGEVNGLTTATKVDTVSRIFFKSTGGGIDSTYKLTYNPADYTLHFGMGLGNVSYQMGQELLYPPIINKTAAVIKTGQPVMIDQTNPIQGDKMRVVPATNIGIPPHNIIGVAGQDISPDADGLVTWFGYVKDVKEADIAATGVTLDVGDILYVSSEAGKYTDVEPAAPALNSTIAIVVRKANPNNLTLLVRPWLNENLDDLRNVNTSGITNGQSLKWNTSSQTWTPQSYIPSVGASNGQIIKWDGAAWIASNYNTYQILNTTQAILPSVNQVFVNTLTSNINLTLPTCNALSDGSRFEFVKAGSDNFSASVILSSGQTFFDNTSSKSLYALGNSLSCTCRWDGTTGKWIHKW
jgi:hypothetical protein